jgi:DNA-binding GntR family transcriptional regulator
MELQRPPSLSTQIYALLRERVLSGEFKNNGRLPAENELASQLQVSRTTIRSALAMLEAELLVYRIHGSGTYVNEWTRDIWQRMESFWEFPRLIEKGGMKPRSKHLCTGIVGGNEEISAKLKISPSDEVVKMETLFEANDIPAALALNFVPTSLVKDLNKIDTFNLSFLGFFRDNCYKVPAYFLADIIPVLPNDQIAAQLHLNTKTPLILMECAYYSENEDIIALGLDYYNPNIFQFRTFRPVQKNNDKLEPSNPLERVYRESE